ncbi:hypothetical protein J4450_03440 [Candidatus Micrarchaeota archaeon]|nr:hypothetical protein [Candidatus Micrarchaeota archaeon]
MKNTVTILLVVLALVAAYLILANPSKSIQADDNKINDTINKTDNSDGSVEPDVFAEGLLASSDVFIIQDLRDVNSDVIRKNIQQCGIDFAGSTGLVGKNITIFALEGSECTTLDGVVDLNSCLNKINAATNPIINIKQGNQSKFYKTKLEVGISEGYAPNSCNINIKLPEPTPQPEPVPTSQPNNQTNSS